MEATKIVKLAFMFITISQIGSVKSDSLTDFLTQKLENYTGWLKANNLDPSPLRHGPEQFGMSNLILSVDVDIRNYEVAGHSEVLQIGSVRGSLADGSFTIWYVLRGNITISGEHISSGKVISGTPIIAEGTWHVSTSLMNYYSNIWFEILPTGYLRVTGSGPQLASIDIDKIHFENLSDNDALVGYEEYFNEPFNAAFKTFWSHSPNDPISSYMGDYWTEILSATTLADIIGTTTHPPTSTPAWSTTTDNPCLVSNHADPDMSEISEKGEVVEIKVIERFVKVEANGARKMVTKTVTTTEQEL